MDEAIMRQELMCVDDMYNNNHHLFQTIVHVQCVRRVLKQMQDVAV